MPLLNTAKDVKLGTAQVQNVYRGSTLVWANKPGVPGNFRATNIGSLTDSVTLAWDAVPNAVSYKIYRTDVSAGEVETLVTTQAGLTYVASLSSLNYYRWWVSAVNASGREGDRAPQLRIRGGRAESSIAAGSTTVGGNVQSANRFRQGSWNYGGDTTPYIGWYSTEAYRYSGFYEIPDWLLRNAIFGNQPQLNGYQAHISCTGARLYFSRVNGVGNMNNAYSTQVSLANGLSYGSSAEPGAQANVYNFTINGQASGVVGYAMPPNWFQAIYQNHASYNGLLFRPYKNSGARQEYMAISTAASWQMDLSWSKIVTVSEFKTSYWT